MKCKRIVVTITDKYGESRIVDLLKKIKKTANIGHSFDVVVDPNGDYQESFNIDGDGGESVCSVLVSEFDDAIKPASGKSAEDSMTAAALNAYLGRKDPAHAMDKDATRDKGGLFDDTRRTYTGESLIAILGIIENYGCLPWDKMDDREKQEFKDAQRAAGDYVHSISKENLNNPCDFRYRKR